MALQAAKRLVSCARLNQGFTRSITTAPVDLNNLMTDWKPSAVHADSSLHVVEKGLSAMRISYHEVCFGGNVLGFLHQGCHVPVGDGVLSIQTQPSIAGSAFAETMLVQRPTCFSDTDLQALGYLDSSVQRFDTPLHLFAHVREVLKHGAATAMGAGGSKSTGEAPSSSP
jgi:hypothetical protein